MGTMMSGKASKGWPLYSFVSKHVQVQYSGVIHQPKKLTQPLIKGIYALRPNIFRKIYDIFKYRHAIVFCFYGQTCHSFSSLNGQTQHKYAKIIVVLY